MATNLLQAAQEDERRKAAALGQPRPNSFGDAAARGAGVTQIPTGGPGAYAPGTRGAEVVAAEQAKIQNRAATGMAIKDALAAPFGKGSSQATPSLNAPATPATPASNPTDARLAEETQTTPATIVGALNQPNPQPNPQPGSTTDPAATTGREVVPVVYNHGRGQYSDNAAGMGFAPSFTGRPNAQNMAAADALAGRDSQRSMGAVLSAQQPQTPAVQTPTALHSGNSWQARNDLRNLEVAASSIAHQSGRVTNDRGRVINPGVGDNGAREAYIAAVKNDLAMRGAQPGLDAVAMRENASLQREGMQQTGATTRTGMTEQGANARESGRSILARDEFNLRKEASGFQTRAAQQQERLRNVLLDQKATPEQRAVAQRNLAALSGKTAADRMQTVALPDTTNEMGQVVRGGQALVRVLEDGSVQQVPIGAQQGAAMPPGMTKQVGTSNGRPVYEDAKGNRFVG